MKHLIILFFAFALSNTIFAQTTQPNFKLSIQTDLVAYTTPGGYSIWAVAQHHQNRLALAYVNFPDRYKAIYEETGIKENDRFARIQLARHFNPETKMRNFFYGANVEYHWRELEEDGTSEVLTDNNVKLGPIIGFEWLPFSNKDNALNNLSLVIWAGPNFILQNEEQERTFATTGSVYEAPEAVEAAVGINISYTFFKVIRRSD